MRQSVRVLGWTVTITTILIALFVGSAVYSMIQTLMMQGFSFSGYQPHSSEDGVVFSLFFSINNTGYYDISDLNLTTCIRDFRGTELSKTSTTVPTVEAGDQTPPLAHNLSVSLGITENLLHLLFEDGNFSIDTSLNMRYAYALAFQLQIPNMSLPWGAPLYNFSLGDPEASFLNETHYRITVPLSFENHAFLNVSGSVHLEIHNSTRYLLGSGVTVVDVLPGASYGGLIEIVVPVENPLTETGYVSLSFDHPVFSFGPEEYTYG